MADNKGFDSAGKGIDDDWMHPRELNEANERFINRYIMACRIDFCINIFKWSGWGVAIVLLVKGC